MPNPVNPVFMRRREGNVQVVQNVRQTIDIGRDGVVVALRLHLSYTITNSAAAPTGPVANAAIQLLQRLEFLVNGRDTPINVQPWLLLSRVIIEQGGAQPQGFETPLSAAANGVTNVDIVLPIHLDAIEGRRQDDLGIDGSLYTQLTLGVTWGSVANLWTVPNAAVLSNIVLSVEGDYLLNANTKLDNNPQSKTFNQVIQKPYLARQLTEISQPVQGTQQELATLIDSGTGLLVRSLLIATITNNAFDDSLIYTPNGNLKMKSGAFVFWDREAKVSRSDLRDVPFTMHAADIQVGIFMLRPIYAGQMSSAIDTSQLLAGLYAYADVVYTAGQSFIWYQIEGVRPLQVN